MNKIVKPSAFSRRRFLTAAGLLVPAAAFPGIIVPSSRRLHMRSTPALPDNGVEGSIEPDGEILIYPIGSENHGSADISHVLYDDFRGQVNGARLSLNAVVGNWDNNSASAVVSTAQSKMGSGRSYFHNGAGVMNFNFTPSTGFRGSFWMYCPTDPGTTTGGRSKTSWVMDGNDGSGVSEQIDLAFPTKHFTQDYGWGVSGNDFNLVLSMGRWMYASEWCRVMFSFSSTKGWRCLLLGPTAGQLRSGDSRNIFEIDDLNTSTTVDWWKFGSTTDPTYYFDGIQCHIGDGANACIELGDAENYEECEQLFDCDILSWGAPISAKIRAPQSFLSGPVFLHGHKADLTHFNGGIGRALN